MRFGSGRLARALAAAGLAVACAACASDPENWVREGFAGAPGVRRVLLCPLNLVVTLPASVQSGAQPIEDAIVAYLVSRDMEVELLARGEGRKLWKQAVAEAKAAGAVERGAAIFVTGLAARRAFDVVVMPSLLLHQVHMDSGIATWDGVTRRMKVVDAPEMPSGRNFSTLVKDVAYGGVTGDAWVTSLHVLVYGRDGALGFEGRGGLEVVQQVEHIGPGKRFKSRLVPDPEIFSDPARLREGAARAFAPFLSQPGS